MQKIIIFTVLFTLFGAVHAKADTYPWCPGDAVCSQQRDKRIIVYDPNATFRQTTLMSHDVQIPERNPNAAKYDQQYASRDTYVVNGVAYTKEYFFRPVGGY